MPRIDVFLSYNTSERAEVLALAESLRHHGLRPWLDVCDLPPGVPWQAEIEGVIAAAPAAAVLVGREGLGPWQERESAAVLEEFVRRGARVIPVLLPSAPVLPQLPLFLRAFTWVDLREGSGDQGFERLLWGITGKRPAGALPPTLAAPVWRHNLPWSSLQSLFKGRERELAALASELDAAGSAAKPQALCGLGGIGKTRLAVEYAWAQSRCYHTTFFVSAATPDSLHHGLAELVDSRRLDLRVSGATESEKIEAALDWLRRHPGWLLVLDNVDTPEAQQALRRLLPLEGGHLLVTSRLTSWPAEFQRRSLGTLDRKDSVALLLEATGACASDDTALADTLAERLGDLPLALEQAAAYICARGISFASYLADWQDDRERILDWYDPATTHYPLAIACTWSQSVSRLGLLPRALLRLLSHFSAEPVPVAMLTAGSFIVAEALVLLISEGQPTDGKNHFDVLGSLAELCRYSLVTRQGGAVSVHRVVQEVERGHIPAAQRQAWIQKAVRLINDFAPRPPDDVRTWAVWDELRPHAERVIELAWTEGLGQPTAALMIELGILLSGKGLHGQAEPLLRRALLIDEMSFGPQNPRIAVDLNNLAQILQATGRFEEAEAFMRRALAIDERSFGSAHRNVSRHLSNLAALLKATGRHQEAEPLMRRALAIDEREYGPSHSTVAIRLNNLAMLLEATQRLEEAEPLARRALEITEEVFGPHHPRVASRLINLAQLLQGQGSLDEAEPLVERALAIDEQCFGPVHANVARDRFALASLARSRGLVAVALQHCRQAFEICIESLGSGHPKTRFLSQSLEELAASQTPEAGAGSWRQESPFAPEPGPIFS